MIVKSFSEIATRIHNNENIENVLKDFDDGSQMSKKYNIFRKFLGYAKKKRRRT